MAQCLEITLLPGVDPSEFESVISKEVFPQIQILRRNVRQTSHRLLKQDVASPGDAQRYIWLVFTALVGGTPETAGEGPDVLAIEIPFVNSVAHDLAKYAMITRFSEVIFPDPADGKSTS